MKWKTRKPVPSNQFSHLFNAYAQYFNKCYDRHGSLFEHPFKRKLIHDENYYKQVFIYIHNNPVHHGFCSHPSEYGWSSYNTYVSSKSTGLYQEIISAWFGSKENFVAAHEEKIELMNMDEFLDLGIHSYKSRN